MSLEDMPLVLKNMLIALLDDNNITSWNIRGLDGFTQVSIRFTNMIDHGHHNNKDIVYRKVPPSRMARDTKRRGDWQNGTQLKNIATEVDLNIQNDAADNFQNPSGDHNTTYVSQGTIQADTLRGSNTMGNIEDQLPSQADQSVQRSESETLAAEDNGTMHSKPSISIESPSPPESSYASHIIDKQDGKQTKNVVHCYLASQAPLDMIEFECDSCKNTISDGVWYRCTFCCDYDLCIDCWKDDKHSHHKNQIHKYTDCGVKSDLYCDSCGALFDKASKVFCCFVCEDYALCPGCKHAGMHSVHKNDLHQITQREYELILK